LAGFEVTLIGRFWVTAEAVGPKTSDLETLLAIADKLMYQQKSNRQFARDEGAPPEESG
jgi:hypothetical protein